MATHLRKEKSNHSADRNNTQRLVFTQRTCCGEAMSFATKLEVCAVSRIENVFEISVMITLSNNMFIFVCS